MPTRLEQRVVNKTADYTINPAVDRGGTIFTNRGAAGAVIFTLPAPNRALLGTSYETHSLADQNVTVKSPTAGDVVTKNDSAANSVAASTAGEKLGAVIEATCIEPTAGTFKWLVRGIAVGHTYTVAT